MLIQKLVKKQQLQLATLVEQSQLQQRELQLSKQQLQERTQNFIGTPPGLMLSFTVGCLFQLRHSNTVKTLRSLVGFRWITKWLT